MINKFGLYRNKVSRMNIPYLKSDRYDDQTQGWWLPFKDKNGDIHLVDTYHIKSGNILNHKDPISSFVKYVEEDNDGTWYINKSNYDYYYGGSVKITPDTKQYFEEVCDLREFEIFIGDINDYKEEDIITNVQLYFEHSYPFGVNLIRKGAKKDLTNQALNIISKTFNSVKFSYINDYDLNELKKYAEKKELDENLRKELILTQKYIKKVLELENLKRDALNEYRKECNLLKND